MDANLSQVIAALIDPDSAVRSRSAEQLSRLGPDARPAATSLVQACADESEEVREWVVAALEELGPPLASDVDALSSLLSNENADVGYWAATLLGRLEHEASPAVPALAAAVSGPLDMRVRQRAAWALGKIGPPAVAALDVLREAAAAEDDPRMARLAQQAIDRISC